MGDDQQQHGGQFIDGDTNQGASKSSTTTRLVRPVPLRAQTMKTPQTQSHGSLMMMGGGYHLAGGSTGNRNGNVNAAAAAAGLLRPGQLIRQGSWSGQASAGMMDDNTDNISSGSGLQYGDQHSMLGAGMTYPIRPHTTQPMDTPLARYSSGTGQPMLMMVNSSNASGDNHLDNAGTSGIQTNFLYKNQDPFSVDGQTLLSVPRNQQTVHMEDLLPQSGSNAFSSGLGSAGSSHGGRPVGLTRSTSAFGHRMSVAEAFDEEEEEEDEDDRSTASPTDKAGRLGYLQHQQMQYGKQQHHHGHQQQQQHQPLQLSSSQLALSGARAVSPTGTMVSRSLTPFSESSYQASVASTKMKKRSLAVRPPPPSNRRAKQQPKDTEVDDESDSAADEDDGDENEEDADEEEDEDDEDEDEGDSVVEGHNPRATARVAQGSPTRRGKGKDAKSAGTLKQTALLTTKSGKAATATAGKKAKSDVKTRDATRKPPGGLNTKSANTEKDKPYVPEGLPPPPRSAEKPSWSYAALIGQAILSSSRKRLALNQIYAWISAAYPYFKPGESGWMNSIRHNLSLNDCFVKGERNAEEKGGKGSVWMVDPKLEFQFKDGGFKKQQKARQVAAHDSDLGSSAVKSKKRKAVGDIDIRRTHSVEMATPIMRATPIMLAQPHFQGPHGLQCSPLPIDAPLSSGNYKRPRLEKANTWATPMQPGSRPGSGAGLRRNSGINGQGGIVEPEEESGLTREQIANLRRLTGSPRMVNLQTGMLIDRGSPEETFQHVSIPTSAPPVPMAARLAHNGAGPQGKFNADDYTTPNRPHSSNPLHRAHLLSSSMMMPQLTPSASSPVSSSPYPATISRTHSLDRRTSQMHDGSDSDDAVRIRQDGDGLSSDPVVPETIRKPYSIGLQPAPQLDGAFVIPAPPAKAQRPKTTPLETNFTSNTQGGHTLSPIIDRKPQKFAKTVSLPGPGDLLSQSPRLDRSNASAADVLGHLERLPRSPIGPSYASSVNSDSFATPMNPMSRHRTAGFTPRTNVIGQLTTPSRNAAGIPHETPIGNVKLQFKAEHRLLDSPMGLPGSCYDLGNHGYQVDWELEQMTNRGSPTSGGCRRTEGESVARTLFEVESGPFSDP